MSRGFPRSIRPVPSGVSKGDWIRWRLSEQAMALADRRRLQEMGPPENRETTGTLAIARVSLSEARDFVRRRHRHADPLAYHLFSVGCYDTQSDLGWPNPWKDRLVGVVTVHRPGAPALDDEWTAQVARLCTDGTKNAGSKLLGTAVRAAWAMGFRRLVSYTLPEESGATYRACGWNCTGVVPAKSWNTRTRPRKNRPLTERLRWELWEPRLYARAAARAKDTTRGDDWT